LTVSGRVITLLVQPRSDFMGCAACYTQWRTVMRWFASAAVALALSVLTLPGTASSTPIPGSAPTAYEDWEIIETTYGGHEVWVLNNDTDPDEGDTLRVVGVSGPDAYLFGIGPNGSSLIFGGPAGAYSVTYTVEDSEGLQSSAQASVLAFTIICGPVECT
jgi:Big-like domain-containing protein